MQDGMDAVLDRRGVAHQCRPPTRQLTEPSCGRIRLPHAGQVPRTQQLGERCRIHFVRLDFGLGDGCGAHGIGHYDFGHERSQQLDDRPGVGGRFDGYPTIIGVQVLLCERLQLFPCNC